jgi:hypothetical protein
MKKVFIGSSPASTIAGYVLAALMIVQDMTTHGETNWTQIAIAVGIAVLGHIVKDSDGKTSA